MILISKTFQKQLDKLKSVWILEIESEIKKHESWLENFIEIWNVRNRKVLKWYLLHKKVRLLVLYKVKNGNYLPFYIVRKETKFWKNITKDSLKQLSTTLDSIFLDLENNDYSIIQE